ncbi:MAG: hypothetical protein HRK26_05270 [Rickettsiaceae bacterium H1]|nr:hypothetical protein [Rickettsiaceae bacterium H1]
MRQLSIHYTEEDDFVDENNLVIDILVKSPNIENLILDDSQILYLVDDRVKCLKLISIEIRKCNEISDFSIIFKKFPKLSLLSCGDEVYTGSKLDQLKNECLNWFLQSKLKNVSINNQMEEALCSSKSV